MLAHCVWQYDREKQRVNVRYVHCHSYLRDGVWEYLSDSTHTMAGQKAPAPEWPNIDYV